jgi:hypothetical protein
MFFELIFIGVSLVYTGPLLVPDEVFATRRPVVTPFTSMCSVVVSRSRSGEHPAMICNEASARAEQDADADDGRRTMGWHDAGGDQGG